MRPKQTPCPDCGEYITPSQIIEITDGILLFWEENYANIENVKHLAKCNCGKKMYLRTEG